MGPCSPAVSTVGPTAWCDVVWDPHRCVVWLVLQEGERVRYGSAFLPFIIPSPNPLPSKRNLHLHRAHHMILCLQKKRQPLIGVWFCIPIFYHTIVPSPILNLPEKSSSSAFTASCEYLPCHETTYPVNLVITPIQLLLLFCLFLFNIIMVWFSIAAFYHTISRLPEKSSSSL